MTGETRRLFDASWEIRPCDVGYDVVSAYNSIAEGRIFVAHADSKSTANRLARLPELYDALMQAVKRCCSSADMGCPKQGSMWARCRRCNILPWLELLRKVRDGE